MVGQAVPLPLPSPSALCRPLGWLEAGKASDQWSQSPSHPGLAWSFSSASQDRVSANLPLPVPLPGGIQRCYPGPKGLWLTICLRETPVIP